METVYITIVMKGMNYMACRPVCAKPLDDGLILFHHAHVSGAFGLIVWLLQGTDYIVSVVFMPP